MAASWDSLFLPSASQAVVADTLRQTLESLGYTLFDPFGLLPGKHYPQTVRLFVAPSNQDWVRVIGTPDPRLLMPLSAAAPCLYLGLHGTDAVIEVYARGGLRLAEYELLPYLRAGHTTDHLKRALYDDLPADAETTGGVFAHLPDEVRALGSQVDTRRAQQMFDRLSGNLLQKASPDADVANAAHDLIHAPDWGSMGGRRIRAVVDCLTLAENWREPDFVTLRDAYQLRARRRRKPDARLYPGDADTMNRVPDALEYVPVYAGRD